MHTSEAKSILTCLFAPLHSGEGNSEMVEVEVHDVQAPEQGRLYFMLKTEQKCAFRHLGSVHSSGRAAKYQRNVTSEGWAT